MVSDSITPFIKSWNDFLTTFSMNSRMFFKGSSNYSSCNSVHICNNVIKHGSFSETIECSSSMPNVTLEDSIASSLSLDRFA